MPIPDFFARSEELDRRVLKQLSHINQSWELSWDANAGRYFDEPETLAPILNAVLEEVSACPPPARYHEHEDELAKALREKAGWPVDKVGARWIRTDGSPTDYEQLLEQGGFWDTDQAELMKAAAGRVAAAQQRGQSHFDDMEIGHQKILAGILAVIVYHRAPVCHIQLGPSGQL